MELTTGDFGGPPGASNATGPGQKPEDPRTMDPVGEQTLESRLRGMLLHGGPPPVDPRTQLRHPSGLAQQAQQAQQQPIGIDPAVPGHLHQLQTAAAPPQQSRLPPSPNIHHQHLQPRLLQRSNTLPPPGGLTQPPPGLERAGTFHGPVPVAQFGYHGSYPTAHSQRGRYGNRRNGFQNAPVPQMNNNLHFPPLGTVPSQPPPPLSERSSLSNMNNPRRHSGPGHYHTDNNHSPPYKRYEAFHGAPGSPQGYSGSPPQNRQGRPYHSSRGSHGGRNNRNFWPLDYDGLTNYAKYIVESVSPTPEEIAMKDNMLRRISEICDKLVPGSRIIPFGSLVSGFATKGADMDVIFAHDTIDPAPSSHESNIPVRLANEFLKRGFEVDLLIKTRVPILKLKTPGEPVSRPGSPVSEGDGDSSEEPWPENVSCDIGFKAHLGITNSHFFRTYSHCDHRFREMVLFVKQWSKNRDLNSPYFGTLSSYGYVLMVAHFLINVVQPPVLPNLQLIPPAAETAESELMQEGFNIWYFKDLERIASGEFLPGGRNEMSLGQLVHEFFQYYTTNFNFVSECVTIRTPGGVMYKQEKGWTSARERVGEMNNTYQDRYLLALEDPFEVSHNVGRTCGGAGVRRIRAEMQRAAHIIRKVSAKEGGTPRSAGWEMPLVVEDLMTTVRETNRGFRNRRVNQKNLMEWIRNDWTVGKCLVQIDAAAEELRKKRELGLPDDAELPPESEEDSEGDEDASEEEEESSSDDGAVRVVGGGSRGGV
ncbi:hypothetical protein DRE_06970 [Drechslerella stenobrocha 248]|uniref:polynucleotide adenylyltransferase n=1 Tax=Drechslerella stenobrocha 248 TaxID=1043628 RepID=W7I651_9PEZI|nr:hypothetical protein DRE_06970 [Drechslerella stenobrocha 248]